MNWPMVDNRSTCALCTKELSLPGVSVCSTESAPMIVCEQFPRGSLLLQNCDYYWASSSGSMCGGKHGRELNEIPILGAFPDRALSDHSRCIYRLFLFACHRRTAFLPLSWR